MKPIKKINEPKYGACNKEENGIENNKNYRDLG